MIFIDPLLILTTYFIDTLSLKEIKTAKCIVHVTISRIYNHKKKSPRNANFFCQNRHFGLFGGEKC